MRLPENLLEFWNPDPSSPLAKDFRPAMAMLYACPYAVLKKANKPPRLGDLLCCVIDRSDPEFLTLEPEKGEFALFDHRRAEKGFFEIPKEAKTPEYITGLIESHFGAKSMRITQTLWVV